MYNETLITQRTDLATLDIYEAILDMFMQLGASIIHIHMIQKVRENGCLR